MLILIAEISSPSGASIGLAVGVPLLTAIIASLIVANPPGTVAPGYAAHLPSAVGLATGAVIIVMEGGVLLGIASGLVLAGIASARAGRIVSPPMREWSEKELQLGYAGLPVALLLSLSVAPSYVVFQDALDHAMESWTRAGQLHAAQADLIHDERVRARMPYEVFPASDALIKQPESKGVYRSAFFKERATRCQAPHDHDTPTVCDISAPDDSSSSSTGTTVASENTADNASDSSASKSTVSNTAEVSWPDPESAGLAQLVKRHFTGLLPAIAPVYSPAIERTRRITIDQFEPIRSFRLRRSFRGGPSPTSTAMHCSWLLVRRH
jgi:hypothetical protein